MAIMGGYRVVAHAPDTCISMHRILVFFLRFAENQCAHWTKNKKQGLA